MSSTISTKTLNKIYGHASLVISGEEVACEKVKLACQRFERELDRSQHDDKYPWRFDEQQAVRPIEFMERFLAPTKGDYDTLELLPWQCFVEGNLYGWVHRETGLRRFREGLIVVGRGNGKSTLMAGNSTFGVSKDGEKGADIYLLANSKEQAGIVFEECKTQIQASRFLRPRFRTLRDGVYFDATNSHIRHRSSDSKRLDGLNPHMAIFDEIHEYKDFKLINVIKRGMNKRRQPLAIYITTMGTVLDGPLMYFYNRFTDAMIEDMLPAHVADSMFAYICELDTEDDIENTDVWQKANPSMGVLLDINQLKLDWDRTKLIPGERSDFITKQLNISVDTSDASFVDISVLKRNQAVMDPQELLGRPCYGGFDLSSREDFTAAALHFPLDDGRIFVLHHSWVPKRKVEMDNEHIDYYEWALQGHLTICDGEYIEQGLVYDWFVEQAQKYEILGIGYDPANAVWLQRRLEAKGFLCHVIRQGPITLNDPMKDMREILLDGRLVMNNDPMLRWYIHNVKLRNDYRDREKENWVPTKRNRYRKIDGFMAMLDAHTLYMQQTPVGGYAEPDVQVYELF